MTKNQLEKAINTSKSIYETTPNCAFSRDLMRFIEKLLVEKGHINEKTWWSWCIFESGYAGSKTICGKCYNYIDIDEIIPNPQNF